MPRAVLPAALFTLTKLMYMNFKHRLTLLLTPFVLGTSAFADKLTLTVESQIDIQALNLAQVGDLAFDVLTESLWISEGAANGRLYRLDSTTGALVSSVDPSVIPGLDQGADAIATRPSLASPDLFVFSPFDEVEGGRITHFGELVVDFNTAQQATGADFDSAGRLWTVSGVTLGGGMALRRIDIDTGAVLETLPISPGLKTRMVDVAFDPHTGTCYVLTELGGDLFEINMSTGHVVSSLNLTPFLSEPYSLAGGIEFDRTGSRLFVAKGTGVGAAKILVFRRDFGATVCSSDFIACPCNNRGLSGRGCDNSFATGGGLIYTSGLPRVSDDTLELAVLGLPPVTSCFFFQGTHSRASMSTFGDGILCVGGSVIRLGSKLTSGGAASYPGAGDASISVRGSIPAAGATRFYQAWYRNVVPFCTPDAFNLSNAIKVPWAP